MFKPFNSGKFTGLVHKLHNQLIMISPHDLLTLPDSSRTYSYWLLRYMTVSFNTSILSVLQQKNVKSKHSFPNNTPWHWKAMESLILSRFIKCKLNPGFTFTITLHGEADTKSTINLDLSFGGESVFISEQMAQCKVMIPSHLTMRTITNFWQRLSNCSDILFW